MSFVRCAPRHKTGALNTCIPLCSPNPPDSCLWAMTLSHLGSPSSQRTECRQTKGTKTCNKTNSLSKNEKLQPRPAESAEKPEIVAAAPRGSDPRTDRCARRSGGKRDGQTQTYANTRRCSNQKEVSTANGRWSPGATAKMLRLGRMCSAIFSMEKSCGREESMLSLRRRAPSLFFNSRCCWQEAEF